MTKSVISMISSQRGICLGRSCGGSGSTAVDGPWLLLKRFPWFAIHYLQNPNYLQKSKERPDWPLPNNPAYTLPLSLIPLPVVRCGAGGGWPAGSSYAGAATSV